MRALDPEEWREIHNRRVHVTVRVASLANPADILNVILIAVYAIPSELSTFRLVWLLASVALMVNSPRMWWPRCWKPDFVATPWDVKRLVADVVANAALILIVLLYAMPSADQYQRLTFLTAYAGVMGCGAIVLSTYRSVAWLWVWMNAATLTVVVWINVNQVAAVLTAFLVLYGSVLSIAIAVISLSFVTRCRAEMETRAEREAVRSLLRSLEDDVNEWLWECNASGTLTHVSESLAVQTGRNVDEICGAPLVTTVAALLDTSTPEARASFDALQERFVSRTSFKDLTVPVRIDGERRWWSLTGHHLETQRDAGWRGIGEDVTNAKVAAAEVLRLATTDGLTGLINRNQFNHQLEAMIERRAGVVHLAIVDLDNFKAVNDSLGHRVGDQLLVEVATRLGAAIGPDDFLARIGGDEFAIVRVDEAERPADFGDVIRLFDEPFTPPGIKLTVHASVGHAAWPRDAREPHALVVAADLALYAAKAKGGARATAFDAALAVQARDRQSLVDELTAAIAAKQFIAFFQPQVDLVTGEVGAMEALARWKHPTRGIVAPGSFITVAEETGLIAGIGEQVMEHAMAAALSWPAHVHVAVNVSAHQLSDPGFVARVTDMLSRHGLDAYRLDIEVTETTMVQRDASPALAALRDLGVGISIDDFGTGYASFEALRMLRPSKLKVDRTFVAALDGPEPESSRAILRAYVALADALRITSVAEGAETSEQRDTLAQLGFHYSQGYIDGRPAAPEDLSFSTMSST